MHNFKRFAKIVLVLLVCVLLLRGLDLALYPCTFMRNDVHAITTEHFDELIVGTSHGKMNIVPDVLEQTTGLKGHNVCVGSEYPVDVYHLLMLACEKQQAPKRVIYEISPGYFVQEKEEGNNYLLFYHEFPLSKAKLSYFKTSIAKCNFRTVLFPWYEYSLSYELGRAGKTLSQKLGGDYDVASLKSETQEYHEDGWIQRNAVHTENLDPEKGFAEVREFATENVIASNMEYLQKTIRFCKDNGIEFVAVTTPVPQPTLLNFESSYREAWGYFDEFFAEEGVPYVNFNAQYYNAFPHKIQYFTDYDGHMNGKAAQDFSAVLADILTNYLNKGE
ncbi:MAG: hypothetical protein IJX90_00720 [Blautia sp.]|nr:hypothetical protein [Blautia sp.]